MPKNKSPFTHEDYNKLFQILLVHSVKVIIDNVLSDMKLPHLFSLFEAEKY